MHGLSSNMHCLKIQSTLVISKSKGPSKTLQDIRTSTYQICRIEENTNRTKPDRVAQSVGHLTRKSGVLGSIPGLATYFRFSFRFFKKGSCQLLAKVCARSTG